jgi:hypothetical protein
MKATLYQKGRRAVRPADDHGAEVKDQYYEKIKERRDPRQHNIHVSAWQVDKWRKQQERNAARSRERYWAKGKDERTKKLRDKMG